MAKQPAPTRPQLLLAAFYLLIGVFCILKSGLDYVATGTVTWYVVALGLAGLAISGRTLRKFKDSK